MQNLQVFNISTGTSADYTFSVDVDGIESIAYYLYHVLPPTSGSNTYAIISGNVATAACLNVGTPVQSHGNWTIPIRFCPSQLTTPAMSGQCYGLQIYVNEDQGASIDAQREPVAVFYINNIIDATGQTGVQGPTSPSYGKFSSQYVATNPKLYIAKRYWDIFLINLFVAERSRPLRTCRPSIISPI